MRQLKPHALWIGHAGDGRDLRAILDAGIDAVVDLALGEPPIQATRELVYCRFPLVDGAGNSAWLVQAAIHSVVRLLKARVPTLIFCSAGLSRSPCIAAAALAAHLQREPAECLQFVTHEAPSDVSPDLWKSCLEALELAE
jgi:protein-tyrosine phosphatase